MRMMLPLVFMALLCGCSRVSLPEARNLVTRYNEVVSGAYRRGDVRLIDAVVGPDAADGKRLAGLIGVRLDMGLTLDAHLESLEVVGVHRQGADLLVHTKEQWRYRDLETASKRQIGQASVDHYEMQYRFKSHKGAWLVEETSFAAPPQVGRTASPWNLAIQDAHGMMSTPPKEERRP